MPPLKMQRFFLRCGGLIPTRNFECRYLEKIFLFKNPRVSPCKILNEKGGIYKIIFDSEQKIFLRGIIPTGELIRPSR